MRVVEATLAGIVIAVVTALIAARVGGDWLLAAAFSFLIAFGGWASTGRTTVRYGRRRRH